MGPAIVEIHLARPLTVEFDANTVHLFVYRNPSHLRPSKNPFVLGQGPRKAGPVKRQGSTSFFHIAARAMPRLPAGCVRPNVSRCRGLRVTAPAGTMAYRGEQPEIGFTTAPHFSAPAPNPR